MDKRLERIEKLLDDQNEHLASIDTTLAEQALDLKYHVKRTNKLEEMVLPLHNLRNEIKFVIRIVYFVSAIAAIVECIRAFK